MSPPAIVIVNDFAHVNGGASQVALSSAVALAERGYRVHLFSAVGPVAEGIKESGVKVTLLGQYDIAGDPNRLRAVTQGIWNRRAARALRELLAECDPASTVVHFHVWIKALSSSVCRAVFDSGFASVVTMHDFFLACPNGGFFDYPGRSICERSPLSIACLRSNCDKRSYAQKIWRCLRQVIQRSRGGMPRELDGFISISDLSEEILRPFLPRGATIHRVSNPISVEKRPPAKPAESDRFLFVGRLDPEKGPLLLAQAAADLGVKVTFVGEGPVRQPITNLLPEAEITGWISPREVGERLRSARALLFPSLWYETQGLTVLEAAAVGVPALVPDTSAAREMVEDGVTGAIFRGGDATDLGRQIERFSDDGFVARCGATAFERYWAAPTTLESHVQQLEGVYDRILAERP